MHRPRQGVPPSVAATLCSPRHPPPCCCPALQRAGEAEAATEKKPSCFPDFASVAEFQAWVGGAAASAASPASRASWIAAAAAAAAGALAAAL